MKKNYLNLLQLFLLTLISGFSYGQSDIYESYVIINSNGLGNQFYDLKASSSNPNFEGFNLGTFVNSNSLILNGAENKTVKCGNDNIINGWLSYRIYLTADTPPSFSTNEILYNSDIVGAGLGCQNQMWQSSGANIDILSGLASGDYYLEVYTHADGDSTGGSNHDFTLYANNGISNYKATFRVDKPPIADCVPDFTLQLDGTGSAAITAAALNNDSTDDFDSASLLFTIDIDTFDCSNLGTPVTVTLTVTDSLGQTDTCAVDVTVEDTSKPELDPAPPDITVQCLEDVPAMTNLNWTDNCDPDGTVAGVDSVLNGDTCGGTITRTWNVTDSNGNKAETRTQIITVHDTFGPELIDVPGDIIVQCFEDVPAIISLEWTDNCSAGGSITGVDSIIGDDYNGTITRTWSISDTCGNTTVRTQVIQIQDVTAPIIICLDPITTTNDPGECYASGINVGEPTATDNCTRSMTYSGTRDDNEPLNANFPVGTTIITWTATDQSGNTSNPCFQTITVSDTDKPTIACPDPVTVYADASCGAPIATINLGTPTTSDNCEITSITNNLESFGTSLSPGIFDITWTVTDTSNNVETCIQQVTVIDNTIPTITSCPVPLTSYNTDAGLCYTSLSFEASADDYCSSPIITYSVNGVPISFPYNFPVGTTTVLVTSTSGNSQTDTCSFNVTVIDNQKPIISVPANITVPVDLADCYATINLTAPEATDNCGIASVVNDHPSSTFPTGITNVVWTVTDSHGNMETLTQVVTVTDPASISSVSLSASETSPVCIGTPISFTANAVDADSNPLYQWFVNNVSQGTATSTNVWTTSTLAVGANIVTVVLTSGSCDTPKTSNPINITVNPNIPVSFTLNRPTSICEGLASFSIANRQNFGANPLFVWKIDGIVIAGASSDTFSPTTLATGQTVSVEVTSSLACAIPTPVIRSTVVTVNPLPSVTANANGSPTDIFICHGSTLTLTGSGTAVSYTWNNGVTNGFTFTPAVGTYTYTVIGTDINGCRSSDQINVTVVAAPKITLKVKNRDQQEICNTKAIAVITYDIINSETVTVSGLPPGVTYTFIGDVLTISGTSTSTALFTYNYTVNATNATCSPGASATGSIKIYDGRPVIPDEISGISVICPITTTTFSVPLDPNAQRYYWEYPDGFTPVGPVNLNTITLQIDDTFDPTLPFQDYIRVRSRNSCNYSLWRSKTLYKEILSIDLNAGPDASICFDGTWGLSGSVIDDDIIEENSITFEWSDGGAGGTFDDPYNRVSNYTPPSVTVLTSINLRLTAIFPPGLCNGEVSDQLTLKVYPKPTAVVTSAPVICQGDDILITGTPNTTVFYRVVRPNGDEIFSSINLNSSGNAIYYNVPAGEYFGVRIKYRLAADPDCEVPLGGYVFMNAAPTVNAGNDRTICSNLSGAVTLNPTFGGTNPSVAWSTSGDGSFIGNTYTPGPNDRFFGGATLTLTNTPTDGVCSPNSDSMQLIIKDEVKIDTQPFAVNACAGENVTFSVGASGDDLTYQWYRNSTSFPVGTNSNMLTLTNVTAANAGNYFVRISGNSVCGPVTSTMAQLTVNTVVINSNPNNVTVCEGDTAILSATATGVDLTYQWYRNGNPVSGGTSATLTIFNSRVVDSGNYYVLVSGTYCNAISSNTAVLTVTGKPVATITYPDVSYCTSEVQQAVLLTGAFNTGGTYSSAAGLTIDSSTGTITPATSTAGTYTVTYTIATAGGCDEVKANATVTIYEVNPTAFAGADHTTANCTFTSYRLAATPISASGASGFWSVTSSQTSGYFFSNPTSPTSLFTGESGENYTLRWTINNSGDCGNTFDELNIIFPNCQDNIFFDGIDDYASFNNNYNLGPAFSIEVWVKRRNNNAAVQSIFSKRNGSNTSSGYDLSIVNNRVRFGWNNNSMTSTSQIGNSRWYHLAVTYEHNTYTLYVDGKLERTVTGASAPATNTSHSLIGAIAQPNDRPMSCFAGDLDELRIWNKALNIDQIRLMMNQEIENNTQVVGQVTGHQVATALNWSDLIGYYRMNQEQNHITGGKLIANAGGIDGNLVNMAGNQSETAPLPYRSSGIAIGWDDPNAWTSGMVPNMNAVTWNIVQTEHPIHINRAVSVLGLVVNTNKLTVVNDNPLEISKYLKINGTLDLDGESQLLQPEGSVVDYTGTGGLERDQQGTGNRFNYNYWGSPVSTPGLSTARTYLLGGLNGMLYDGDDGRQVMWISGHNGNPGPPVNITRRWLYTYNGVTNYYSEWKQITETSPINIGLGFLMKGAGAVGSSNKNYTFKGQPNNGTIEIAIAAGNSILIGNPYPSAIDADEFIRDNDPIKNPNTNLRDGALSFWEHYESNNTHVLRDYVGGYATYNLVGGLVSATPPPTIDGYQITYSPNGGRKPTRYIPVAQGFFVTASETKGGQIIFKNSQRIFRREANGESIFFRTTEASSEETQKREINSEPEDDIQRVRLTFKSPEGAIRPLLLGFTPDDAATDGIDYGYDAYNNDDFPSDLSFDIGGEKFVIQGVGAFDINKKYPLDMTLKIAGNIEIALSELENFDTDPDVYIHDALLDSYTKINAVSFKLTLTPGNYTDRFSIVFQPDTTLDIIDQDFKEISVKYLQKTDEIYVKTPASIEVRQLYLINMAGQAVKSWNMTNMNFGQEFKIPVKDVAEGNYILQVETNTNSYNKKIIIKF